jgi:hypothetical protein
MAFSVYDDDVGGVEKLNSQTGMVVGRSSPLQPPPHAVNIPCAHISSSTTRQLLTSPLWDYLQSSFSSLPRKLHLLSVPTAIPSHPSCTTQLALLLLTEHLGITFLAISINRTRY